MMQVPILFSLGYSVSSDMFGCRCLINTNERPAFSCVCNQFRVGPVAGHSRCISHTPFIQYASAKWCEWHNERSESRKMGFLPANLIEEFTRSQEAGQAATSSKPCMTRKSPRSRRDEYSLFESSSFRGDRVSSPTDSQESGWLC